MTSYLTSQWPSRWYRLVRARGGGAFGVVYECEVVVGDGVVGPAKFAAKILRNSNDAENVERFAQEARLGGQLRHPNLIRVVDVNLSHNPPYFVMELMTETLRNRLQRWATANAVYRAKAALEGVLLPLCRAVAHLHLKRIYHRDIKPENIYFGRGDNAVLGDLGICKEQNFFRPQLTWCGLGTPRYTAPETLQYGIASPQSDIYSLGVVLYEMLTGRTPAGWWWNNAGNLPSLQHPTSCHRFVDQLLVNMTHPDASRRYSHVVHVMRDMVQLIRTFLPPLPAYRPSSQVLAAQHPLAVRRLRRLPAPRIR